MSNNIITPNASSVDFLYIFNRRKDINGVVDNTGVAPPQATNPSINEYTGPDNPLFNFTPDFITKLGFLKGSESTPTSVLYIIRLPLLIL